MRRVEFLRALPAKDESLALARCLGHFVPGRLAGASVPHLSRTRRAKWESLARLREGGQQVGRRHEVSRHRSKAMKSNGFTWRYKPSLSQNIVPGNITLRPSTIFDPPCSNAAFTVVQIIGSFTVIPKSLTNCARLTTPFHQARIDFVWQRHRESKFVRRHNSEDY